MAHRNGPLMLRRLQSTTAPAPIYVRNKRKRGRIWLGAGLVTGAGLLFYLQDSRAGAHRYIAIPVLHALTDAETSHEMAIKLLPLLGIKDKGKDSQTLAFEWKGLRFSNPIGLAAGFDKDGKAIDSLFDLGFGYVEIGSVTPEPQEGNAKPRVFRLPNTRSLINRYGFNSEGHLSLVDRLRHRIEIFLDSHAHLVPPSVISAHDPATLSFAQTPVIVGDTPDPFSVPQSLRPGQVLALNLGKNKLSAQESVQDYVQGVHTLGQYADVLVVNVSSPNTVGLRSLQKKEILSNLLQKVLQSRDGLGRKPPVLVKIAPDLTEHELEDIASVATELNLDGIIVSNTTVSRPLSAGSDAAIKEVGGLSGPPLKPSALTALSMLRRMTNGEITLVGCGGISTAQDVLDYGRAGATFVQLYTALGYEGPGLPRAIKDDLAILLAKEGKTWQQVVGSGSTLPSKKVLEQEALDRKKRAEGLSRVQFEQGLLDIRTEVEKALASGANKLDAIDQEFKKEAKSGRPVLIQETEQIRSHKDQAATAKTVQPQESAPDVEQSNLTRTAFDAGSGNKRQFKDPFASWGDRRTASESKKRLV